MSAGISQQFCVRWNSHLGSLGAAFPQLLAGQRFVDVTLACEGHQVHCHRLVLAACSTYFESLLGENPCKHPIIILPRDIKLWEIQALVDFMYKGEVNVSQAGLPDLLKCAEALQIRGLCGTDAALNLNHITNSTTTSASTTTTNNTSLHHITATNATANTISTTPATNSTSSSITPSNSTSTPCISRSASSSKVVIGPAISSPSGTTTGLDVTSSTSQITNILRTELLNAATIKLSAQSTTSNASSVSRAGTSISLDDGDDSANGSGSELNIKDEDESDLKMRVDYSDDLDGSSKLQSEFAMANVTCEYDSSASAADNTPGRRIRRSEAILRQAAECVSRGQTFQTVSDMFHIPISTIRFFMARKGILPRRKRGRASGAPFMSDIGGNSNRDREHSRSASPSEPPFHFANYKLPDLKHELL